MKKLVFDFETNGLSNHYSALSFSALLINDDDTIIEEHDRYYHRQRNEKPQEIKYGYNDPKWPKLIEAVEFFDVDTDAIREKTKGDFHSGLFDVYATYEVYKCIKKYRSSKNN